MNTKDLARDSYHLATRLEECPFDSFWVVLLDDGTEVYQNEDRSDLLEPSPWMRLKLMCRETGRKILHMAYAFRNGQGEQINALPSADGYLFSKRIRKMMSQHPGWSGYEDDAVGIGYLRGAILTIKWRRNDGVVETEERNISQLEQKPFNLI
jgi:hypothetical protein